MGRCFSFSSPHQWNCELLWNPPFAMFDVPLNGLCWGCQRCGEDSWRCDGLGGRGIGYFFSHYFPVIFKKNCEVGVVDDCCRCDRGSGLRSYQRELLLWKIKERSEENNFDDHGNIIHCQWSSFVHCHDLGGDDHPRCCSKVSLHLTQSDNQGGRAKVGWSATGAPALRPKTSQGNLFYFIFQLRSFQREERRRMTRKEKMERGWRVRIVCENPENQMLMVKLIIIQVPSPEQANTPKRVESIFIFYFLFAKLKFKFLKCFWKLKSRLLSNPYFGAFGTSRLKEEVSNSCGSFSSSSSTLPGRLIKGTRFSNWQMFFGQKMQVWQQNTDLFRFYVDLGTKYLFDLNVI